LVRALWSFAKDDPGLSFLTLGNDVEPDPVEVVIEKVPRYESLAPVFKQMYDNGASIQAIASAHGMSWQYAGQIIHFAETGERPKWESGSAKRKRRGQREPRAADPIKYLDVAEEVVRLYEKEKMPFARIAVRLGVCGSTVRRAYDHARPEAVRKAAEDGEEPCRGQRLYRDEAEHRKIRKMLVAGLKAAEIAAKAHCGTSTVYRVRREMEAEGSKGETAA
jgi:transposase